MGGEGIAANWNGRKCLLEDTPRCELRIYLLRNGYKIRSRHCA
jgi:hypothetical protein